MDKKKRVLVILGPTSVGKTGLALSLAKKYDGELVACDSRQVYRGLDIGTGKLPSNFSISNFKFKISKHEVQWVINGIKVWMYDVADPQHQYTVKDYIKDAGKEIDRIAEGGKLPIIVGGTGLYLRGLLYGLDNLGVSINLDLREKLEELSLGEIQERLKLLSPIEFMELNNSERNNKRRLIRKIELKTMYPYNKQKSKKEEVQSQKFDALLIGLSAPRLIINKSIDVRLDSRFESGLVEETKNLIKEGVSLKRLKELGLEYEVVADFLEGKIAEIDLLSRLKSVNHQYAKRQMTYFKKMSGVNWFDVNEKNYISRIEKLLEGWYNS